jgi:hypothetical protein
MARNAIPYRGDIGGILKVTGWGMEAVGINSTAQDEEVGTMIGMINMKDYDYYQAHPNDCKLYMEAARLTLRWLSTPNQAYSENAQAKLVEARASLSELEVNQWLQTTSR